MVGVSGITDGNGELTITDVEETEGFSNFFCGTFTSDVMSLSELELKH